MSLLTGQLSILQEAKIDGHIIEPGPVHLVAQHSEITWIHLPTHPQLCILFPSQITESNLVLFINASVWTYREPHP